MKKIKNFKIVENYKIWFLVPAAILFIAIIVFGGFAIAEKSFSRGINIGIDFSSGNILTVELGSDIIDKNYKEYEKIISDTVNGHGGQVSYSQTTGADTNKAISVKYANFVENLDEQKEINDLIKAELEAKFAGITDRENYVNYESMGAAASKNLISTSILAVFVTTLLILIYVSIRFKFWTGLSAVVALVHDVLMVIAFTIIFHIQINTSFIAAIITIVAYSINNTIVIFDRIRENTAINETAAEKKSLAEIANISVKQTLQRSINTSATTLFAIVLLAIIGVASIREFALPVIFGLLSGTFSSIFIAPSLYCLMVKAAQNRKNKSKDLKPYSSKKDEKVKSGKAN